MNEEIFFFLNLVSLFHFKCFLLYIGGPRHLSEESWLWAIVLVRYARAQTVGQARALWIISESRTLEVIYRSEPKYKIVIGPGYCRRFEKQGYCS